MSYAATEWAWKQHVTPTEKLVLLRLADRADDHAYRCWPSVAGLCADTGLHRETVFKAIRGLSAAGLIAIEERKGAGHRYRLSVSPNQCEKTDQSEKPDRLEKADSTSPENQTTTSRKNRTRNLSDESINESVKKRTRTKLVYSDAFEGAWALYPARAGDNPKSEAFAQWRARLKAGRTEKEMLEGVQRYRAFCDATGSTGTQYVKKGKTFFGKAKEETDPEPFTLPWTPPKGTAPARTNFAQLDYSQGMT